MNGKYDWIDCSECNRECRECNGIGFHMAIGNEAEGECNHCDGTGDNPDECRFCEGNRKVSASTPPA